MDDLENRQFPVEEPAEELTEEAVETAEEIIEPAEETIETAEETIVEIEEPADVAQETLEALEESADGEEPIEEAPAPKKRGYGLIAGIVLGVIVALAAVCVVLFLNRGAKTEGYTPVSVTGGISYTAEAMTPELADQVVATNGRKGLFGAKADPAYDLTNKALGIYYWSDFYNFYNQYGFYAAFVGLDDPANMENSPCGMGDSTMTLRHVFVPVENAEDENAWATAESKANEMLEGWKNGEATEETFAALADANSDTKDGGLLEGVPVSLLGEEIEAWASDEARVAGDTTVLRTEEGVQIMYYVGGSTQSWQEYFLSNALNSYQQRSAVVQQARSEGFVMPEDAAAEVETMKAELTAMDDLDEQITDVYGEGITAEDYITFLEDGYYFNAYVQQLQNAIPVTDEELDAYYAEHQEELEGEGIEKSDTPNVNVRHILITPEDTEDEASWAEAESTANTLLAVWQSGEATEESFAALATENTEDPGSAENGGLYEDVYPGQMVEAFNDWCFDSARQPGDTAVVKTEYGYHIMYFVSQSDTLYWKEETKSHMLMEKTMAAIEEIQSKYELQYDLTKVALVVPGQILEASAAQEAAAG